MIFLYNHFHTSLSVSCTLDGPAINSFVKLGVLLICVCSCSLWFSFESSSVFLHREETAKFDWGVEFDRNKLTDDNEGDGDDTDNDEPQPIESPNAGKLLALTLLAVEERGSFSPILSLLASIEKTPEPVEEWWEDIPFPWEDIPNCPTWWNALMFPVDNLFGETTKCGFDGWAMDNVDKWVVWVLESCGKGPVTPGLRWL